MTLPSTDADLADLAAQEKRLVFPRFDHDTAWALGVQLVEAARAAGLPVVVSSPSDTDVLDGEGNRGGARHQNRKAGTSTSRARCQDGTGPDRCGHHGRG